MPRRRLTDLPIKSHRTPTPVCLLLIFCCVLVLGYGPQLEDLDDFTASLVQSVSVCLLALCGPVVARDWCLVYLLSIARVCHRVGARRLLLVVLCVQALGVIPYALHFSVLHFGPQYLHRLNHSVDSNKALLRGGYCGNATQSYHDRDERAIPPFSFGSERCRHPTLYDSYLHDFGGKDLVERYSLEDVVLFCDIVIPTNTDVENITVTMSWYKEELIKLGNTSRDKHVGPRELRETSNSARIAFTSQRAFISGPALKTEPAGTRLYSVTDTIQLRRIQENDFGVYTCYTDVTFTRKPKDGCPHTRKRMPSCKLQLSKYAPREKYLYVPPAGILQTMATFAQLQTDTDEIFVERTINGQPEEVSSTSYCHPGFNLFRYFFVSTFAFLLDVAFEIRTIDRDFLMQKFLTDQKHECTGKAQYGIHKFKITRYFYNPKTQTRDFEETDYPDTLWVAPSFPFIFGDVRDSADFTFFSECWTNESYKESEYCLERQKRIDEYIEMHVLLDLLFLCLVVCLFPLLVLYWWYRLIRFVMHTLLRDVFDGPDVNCQVQATRRSRAPRDAGQGRVFLSYSAADDVLVQELRITLTALRLRIFDCHTDVRLGQPQIAAWDRAVESCSSFIVVVSPDYLADKVLRQLQLPCVLCPVFEGEVSEQRLLIVRVGGSPLPASLEFFPCVCDVTQRHWQRRLEWWALLTSSRSPELPYVIRQAWRDARRDVCDMSRDFWRDIQNGLWWSAVMRVYKHLAKRPTGHPACLEGIKFEHQARVNARQANIAACKANEPQPPDPSAGSSPHVCVPPPASAGPHHVFLTYCEDSPHDRHVSAKVKAVLEGQGLNVFDAAMDVLGGQSETEVVTSASVCPSCVVVLSPAYIRHSLRRRLHFPLVLQGLQSGFLSEGSVLLIITAGTCSRPQRGRGIGSTDTKQQKGEEDEEVSVEKLQREEEAQKREVSEHDTQEPAEQESQGERVHNARREEKEEEEEDDEKEDEDDSDDACYSGIHVPHSLRSAHRLHWSGNLSDVDHETRVTRWAKATRRLQCRDFDTLRRRSIEDTGHDLHRPLTLTSSGRFAV